MKYFLLLLAGFTVMSCDLYAERRPFGEAGTFPKQQTFSKSLFDKEESRIVFYPEIGVNFSRLNTSQSTGRGGVFAGANLKLGSIFFVMAGLKLQNMKYDVTVDDQTNATVVQKSDLWYLNYPVVIGFAPISNELVGLRIYGGGTGSIFLGGNVSNSNLSNADFSKAAWSLTAGAGLDLWRITLNLSYDYGLTEVHTGVGSGHWRTINAGIGFKFY